jgi:hypothetical protein
MVHLILFVLAVAMAFALARLLFWLALQPIRLALRISVAIEGGDDAA